MYLDGVYLVLTGVNIGFGAQVCTMMVLGNFGVDILPLWKGDLREESDCILVEFPPPRVSDFLMGLRAASLLWSEARRLFGSAVGLFQNGDLGSLPLP